MGNLIVGIANAIGFLACTRGCNEMIDISRSAVMPSMNSYASDDHLPLG